MDIRMTFRHIEATDGIRAHAEDKLEKLKKYLIPASKISLIFSMERFVHCVDVTLFEKKHIFKAQARTNDMYASIDQVMHVLEKQLQRRKGKTSHHKNYFKSPEGLLTEAHDLFDQRLSRERSTNRAWKKENRSLRKKVA